MKDKILVVCGPTATGKTSLAIDLAVKLNGELVSADSRQVYKSLDIGTGKDIPEGYKFVKEGVVLEGKTVGYYTGGSTKIWGYDLITPKENISVASYVKIARKIIEKILKEKRLPIIVGGTGLYIKGVIEGISTASIPRDEELRKGLEKKGARELFEILAQLDPIKVASLNESDRKNKRRLVRAIEISSNKLGKSTENAIVEKPLVADVLYIGLIASKEVLYKRVDDRVDERVKRGITEELVELLKSGVDWADQSMSSLGYRQWRGYFITAFKKTPDFQSGDELNADLPSSFRGNHAFQSGEDVIKKIEADEVISKWKAEERKYVSRQLVWFKRDSRIQWFDLTKPDYKKSVEELVRKWYKSG